MAGRPRIAPSRAPAFVQSSTHPVGTARNVNLLVLQLVGRSPFGPRLAVRKWGSCGWSEGVTRPMRRSGHAASLPCACTRVKKNLDALETSPKTHLRDSYGLYFFISIRMVSSPEIIDIPFALARFVHSSDRLSAVVMSTQTGCGSVSVILISCLTPQTSS